MCVDLLHPYRNIWSEAQQTSPAASAPTLDSFYDNTVEEVRYSPRPLRPPYPHQLTVCTAAH